MIQLFARPALARFAFVALAAAVLAGCTQTASAPPPPPPGSTGAGVTPSTFTLPGGSGCAGDVARFRAVLKNDLDTGHVGQGVFDRAGGDLNRADAACAAGRDGEARAIVASTKSRFGYP